MQGGAQWNMVSIARKDSSLKRKVEWLTDEAP